jgi:hypothetical protein
MTTELSELSLAARRRGEILGLLAGQGIGVGGAEIEAALDSLPASHAALRSIARALAADPRALHTGAPPLIGRLANELRARGADLPEPRCWVCARSGFKLTATASGGMCNRCRHRQLAEPCSVCGVEKPVASRDPERRPLCSVCASRPRRECSVCLRVRLIAKRARDGEGEVCDSCFKLPTALCSGCGRERPCNFARSRRPLCAACSPRPNSVCAHCGLDRPACARWPEGPVCEPCYRAAHLRKGTCSGCGATRRLIDPPGVGATRCADCAGVAGLARCGRCSAEERPYRHGLCVSCTLSDLVSERLGSGEGPLASVAGAILSARNPYSACNFLRSVRSGALLSAIARGELALTHEALDALTDRRPADYLRKLLVAHGALAPRDEALRALESFLASRIAAAPAAQRAVLRSYATWRVLRRVRRRAAASTRRTTPTAYAKNCFTAATLFLSFLDGRGRDLGSCTQADVDAFIAEGPPSAPLVGDFLSYAAQAHLSEDLVTSRGNERRSGPALADDSRWAIARRLLHDDELDLADRVAGCLVLLYGQQLARIVTLTDDDVFGRDGKTLLRLGACELELKEPLAALVNGLAVYRRPKTSVAPITGTRWLFPGNAPGQSVNPSYLGERLRRLGISTMPARRSALMHLGATLPASVLADALGINPTTAVKWVKSAGGDWGTYAAAVVKAQAGRGL